MYKQEQRNETVHDMGVSLLLLIVALVCVAFILVQCQLYRNITARLEGKLSAIETGQRQEVFTRTSYYILAKDQSISNHYFEWTHATSRVQKNALAQVINYEASTVATSLLTPTVQNEIATVNKARQ